MTLSYGNRIRYYRFQQGALAVATVGYTNVIDDHGAAGDGATDDSAAFAAANATGKVIYVPGNRTYNLGAGTFSFSAPGMFGDGSGSSILAWTGLTSTEVAMRIDPTTSPFLQNIKLKSTDGNGIGIGDSGASALDFKMFDVALDGFNYGFWCDDLENAIFVQCQFINNTTGAYTDSTAEWLQVNFLGCQFQSNTTGVELGGICDNVVFDNCSFGTNTNGFVITANTQLRRGVHHRNNIYVGNTTADFVVNGAYHLSLIEGCKFFSNSPTNGLNVSPSSGGASDVVVRMCDFKGTYSTDVLLGANTTTCEVDRNAGGVTSDVTDSISVTDNGQNNVVNY